MTALAIPAAPIVQPGCACPACGQTVPRLSGFVPRGDWRTHALETISADLGHHRGDGWRFLEAVFCECTQGARLYRLARDIAIGQSTMASRFFRAGLPAPGRYLRMARLVAACYLLDDPAQTITSVAYTLRYSSQQALGRAVRRALGMAAQEMRARYSGDGMLDWFREDLVAPHVDALRAEPLLTSQDVGLARARRALRVTP